MGPRERAARRRARDPHRAAAGADRALPGQRARRPRQPSGGGTRSRRRRSRLAGDPGVFPEQIAAGLRPWQPLKLYMGGVRENEDWTLRVDTGVYNPGSATRIRTSRASASLSALAERRPRQPAARAAVSYYKRLHRRSRRRRRKRAFSTASTRRMPGVCRALASPRRPAPAALLGAIEREVKAAVQAFTMTEPSASVPALARALAATRAAIAQLGADPDVIFMLKLKGAAVRRRHQHGARDLFTASRNLPARRRPTGPFSARSAGNGAGGSRAGVRREDGVDQSRPVDQCEPVRRAHRAARGRLDRSDASGAGRADGDAPNGPIATTRSLSRCPRTPRSRVHISRARRSRKRATRSR